MNLERELSRAVTYYSPTPPRAVFTEHSFASAMSASAGVGPKMDLRYVRVILADRLDVEVLSGGLLLWHRGWLARFRWWLHSTPCTANCGWRVRQHHGTREHAYCYYCLRVMEETGRALARY